MNGVALVFFGQRNKEPDNDIGLGEGEVTVCTSFKL